MRLIRRRRSRGAALVLVAIMVALSGSSALAAPPRETGTRAVVAADDPETPPAPVDEAVVADPSSTKVTLTRGNTTVSVSRTGGLTRQMLNVSWTGMTPSITTLPTTFPVAVMQCRGFAPKREDCWMSDQNGNWPGLYRASSYAPKETSPWQLFPGNETGTVYTLPFRKKDGTYHTAHNPELEPDVVGWMGVGLADALPTSTIDDYTPGTANQRIGITRPDGTGEVQTWANTKAENASLGCTQNVPCSLVVVPITQHPCLPISVIGETERAYCDADAEFKTDAQVNYWPLLANWYQRYVFKLSFAPPGSLCLDRSDSAKFIGSELMAEAMRRWVPARCAKSSPSSLDFTRGWEPEARRQLSQTDPLAASGYESDSAIVTEPSATDERVAEKRKPGYAPVGISGFAIGFNWDRSEAVGGGQVPEIKLNQRLVAKLLTQSYPGKYRVGGTDPVNPNAGSNPSNLLNDPEFQQLNPDAVNWAGLTNPLGTQMVLPPFKTDVMLALTRWIWADPAARAFVQGKADQWGMTVNKTYKGWQMPRDDYQLNDGWKLPDGQGVYSFFAPQELWSQASNSWSQAADVLMTAWPLSQAPSQPTTGGPIVPKRELAQNTGFRNLLALTSTSELEKSGMSSVKLQNSAGEFVAPSTDSMSYALDGAIADKATGVWRIDPAKMDKRGYPGTMISYAEVPTATLKPTEATRYADTLQWMADKGQLYGQENGELPAGYLALTGPMQDQAAAVALAVRNQTGKPPVPPDDPVPNPPTTPATSPPQSQAPNQNGNNNQPTAPSNNTDNPSNDNSTQPTPTNAPTTPGAPTTNPTKAPPLASGSIKPVSQATQGESLGWLAWGIPALLVAGLAAGVASPGIRIIAQPDHPVRRGLAGLFARGRRRNL
ncbi:hypothetical protein [Kribbella sp. NPDC051718]|uniref:hypothetical protein n=1 Tax=Kribbella sp. NPDC051718 TaxID=3155168 RepID=UPI003433C01A